MASLYEALLVGAINAGLTPDQAKNFADNHHEYFSYSRGSKDRGLTAEELAVEAPESPAMVQPQEYAQLGLLGSSGDYTDPLSAEPTARSDFAVVRPDAMTPQTKTPASPPARSPKVLDSYREPFSAPGTPAMRTVQTGGGAYPVYQAQSAKAQSFRDAFAEARSGGAKTFDWDGRSYSTKVK
jgi:hypothetical protein